MTKEFDKLITDAAPEVPDCGPDRRVARVLLRERRRRHERRRRWLHAPSAPVAASLVLLVLVGGLTGDLGSDFFDLEMDTIDIGGAEWKFGRSIFRGTGFPAPPDMSDDDIYELQQQFAAEEGELRTIEGFSIDGELPRLVLWYTSTVNGKPVELSREPRNLSIENGVPSRRLLAFLGEEGDTFREMKAAEQLQRRYEGEISSDGTVFRMYSWTREYSKWGAVTYYEGTPIEPSDLNR